MAKIVVILGLVLACASGAAPDEGLLVHDGAGQPLDGAHVRVWDQHMFPMRDAPSDDAGRVRLGGLESALAWFPARLLVRPASAPAFWGPASTMFSDGRLRPPEGFVVEGSVLSPDGQPVPGARISVGAREAWVPREPVSASNDDGSFSLWLPATVATVVVNAETDSLVGQVRLRADQLSGEEDVLIEAEAVPVLEIDLGGAATRRRDLGRRCFIKLIDRGPSPPDSDPVGLGANRSEYVDGEVVRIRGVRGSPIGGVEAPRPNREYRVILDDGVEWTTLRESWVAAIGVTSFRADVPEPALVSPDGAWSCAVAFGPASGSSGLPDSIEVMIEVLDDGGGRESVQVGREERGFSTRRLDPTSTVGRGVIGSQVIQRPLTPGAHVRFTFEPDAYLAESGEVVVTAHDAESGESLNDLELTLEAVSESGSPAVYSARSDTVAVPAGVFDYVVRSPGYRRVRGRLTVDTGDVTRLSVGFERIVD